MDITEKIFEFIKQLKAKTKAYFEFGTDCNLNTFQISLNGSSKVSFRNIFRHQF